MRENLTESCKFSAPEVAGLRNSMLQEVLDLRAAAEVLQLSSWAGDTESPATMPAKQSAGLA